MKKRLIALSLVVALAALVIVPVAISKGHAKGKNKFQLNGVVVSTTAATDTTPGAIIVKVKSGTWTVKKFRGLERGFVVSPTAKMIDATVDPAVPTTLDCSSKAPRCTSAAPSTAAPRPATPRHGSLQRIGSSCRSSRRRPRSSRRSAQNSSNQPLRAGADEAPAPLASACSAPVSPPTSSL